MPQTGRIPRWPALALLFVLVLQATLVLGRAINWDEFFHYSQVQKLAAGTLSEPLQTLYTRAFLWITALPGNGIDHIIAARWIMLAFELLTLAAIVGVARHFASRSAAWLCALAYAGAGYVVQHATSFRFDGPAAALLMSAAWIMLRCRLSPAAILGAGLLIAAATMLTIKVVLYAPVCAGIAWLRWRRAEGDLPDLLRLGAIGLVSAAAFALAYWLHAAGLSGLVPDGSTALLGKAGGTMFSLGVQPYWPHHLKGAAIAPIVTVLLLAFPFVLRREARPLAEKLALTGMVLPLATLLFYHNTAPYYFVFMLAPVCAALGPVIDKALERYSEAKIALVLGALALAVWTTEKSAPLDQQRQLLAAAETMFPDHPSYFDASAMLGTFPKANAFMTPVGIALYQQGAYPSMVSAMDRGAVPLVLATDPLFERALAGRDPVPELLPDDLAALREGYVPLWGPFWIAGQHVSAPVTFTIRIPGAYRVEGGHVALDGDVLQEGTVVTLARGVHRAEPRAGTPRLIWAQAGRPPAGAPPVGPWFTDF